MIRGNHTALEMIADHVVGHLCLPEDLEQILKLGFTRRGDEVFFRKYQKNIRRADSETCFDKTGMEVFVNSVYVDGSVHPQHFAASTRFAKLLIRKWRRSRYYRPAVIILESDRERTIVRFHQLRVGESWLTENLEAYEDAIIYVEC